MSPFRWAAPLGAGLGLLIASCNGSAPLGPTLDEDRDPAGSTELYFRDDVAQVTRVEDALPGVFIPAFDDCREPRAGETGGGPDGQVCTHTLISGCTEPGKYYPDYASCDVVRTQRPFWEEPPAKLPDPNDPRLSDPKFKAELAWVTEQVAACACTCCHDSRSWDGKFGQWDIAAGGVWLDTLSDNGLALFAGYADSTALGAYPAEENHGFDRTKTGVPTTDTGRMQEFLDAELARRGITKAEARKVPAFGGPLVTLANAKPAACDPGVGITDDGKIQWAGGKIRYAYVMEQGSKNPVVPPNLDLPSGTLWRLDVLASEGALKSPIAYGKTPKGTFQAYPESASAPELQQGETYHLVLLADPGLAVVNCEFEFGTEPTAPPAAEEQAEGTNQPPMSTGDAGASASCALEDADARGFGHACKKDADCSCEANYCALMPNAPSGYCTVKGCKEDPSSCPSDWYCQDLAMFFPGLPAICSPE